MYNFLTLITIAMISGVPIVPSENNEAHTVAALVAPGTFHDYSYEAVKRTGAATHVCRLPPLTARESPREDTCMLLPRK